MLFGLTRTLRDGYQLDPDGQEEPETVDVFVTEILGETRLAFNCQVDGKDHWIAKSQIRNPENYRLGHRKVHVEMTLFVVKMAKITGYL